jgi:hypothetical protein
MVRRLMNLFTKPMRTNWVGQERRKAGTSEEVRERIEELQRPWQAEHARFKATGNRRPKPARPTDRQALGLRPSGSSIVGPSSAMQGNRHVPRIRKIRHDISREEFNRVVDLLNERGRLHEEHSEKIEELRRHLETQLTRIGQLQAELDRIKKNVFEA